MSDVKHYGPTLAISEEISKLKYRGKGETFKQAMVRVADALKDNEDHYKAFKDILLDMRFLPAGRVQAAMGSPKQVTPFNCFVSATINDSMSGIMKAAQEAAETMRLGGGIGYDFSTLRPRGDLIKSLDSRSSGPISFMGIFDSICKTISSAGHRRGAQMGVLRIDHPDIEEFIEAKANSHTLTQFNISVGVTDVFMEAVKNDYMFDLVFEGRVYKTVRAKALWDKILRLTWDWAEPGILFIDRINQKNNLWYMETIASTNPCVPPETPILTDKGYVEIGSVVGIPINVWNGFEFSQVVPRKTGENQAMVNVELSDGSEITCTIGHKFILKDGTRVMAKDLKISEVLEKSNWPVVDGIDKLQLDYYAQGFFSGDGWVKASTGAQYIGLYGDKINIPHEWKEQSRKTYGIAGGYIGTDTTKFKDYLFFPKGTFQSKNYIPHEASIASKRLWLAGLADSDGTITKDGSIQISSKDRTFLLGVKHLINTMGANANLQPMRDCFRISISASYVVNLQLNTLRLKQVVPQRDARRFLTVVDVTPAGIAPEVFCFTEFKNNSGVFSGVYTAQCAEQPLPPYGACLLGSVNLTKYVKPFFETDWLFDYNQLIADLPHIIRAMDNIIDKAIYPLPQQEQEAKTKRRMGIGVTGAANAIEALGFPYGSDKFLETLSNIMKTIRDISYLTSIDLAKEKGPFPAFDVKLLDSSFAQTLPLHIRADIRKYGLRNSHLLSVAPTGTISLTADNVSSGIEPVFSLSYDRTIQTFDGPKIERVDDYGMRVFGVKGLTANNLSVFDHVKVLNTASKYVDSACSKTCNVGDNVTWEEFKSVYMQAYEGGASGCTTFRASGKRFGILVANKDEDVAEEEVVGEDTDFIEEGGACYFDPATGLKTCE